MGKPYHPVSESFCEYVFKSVCKTIESELEFFEPDKRLKRKRESDLESSKVGVKLLKCSNIIFNMKDLCENDDNEAIYEYSDRYRKGQDANDQLTGFFFRNEGVEISRKDLYQDGCREVISPSFQKFVYKKLAERLENEIKELNNKSKPVLKKSKKSNDSIHLLKSTTTKVNIDAKAEVNLKRRKRIFRCNPYGKINRKTIMSESAVSADWVYSKSGTIGWCETKRPKIINLKLTNTLSDGALECIAIG